MINANLRTLDDARKLWCATSNQMCRADECGHWLWVRGNWEMCSGDDEGAEKDEYLTQSMGAYCYTRVCAALGRCGITRA